MNAIEMEQAKRRAEYDARMAADRAVTDRIHAERMATYYAELDARKAAEAAEIAAVAALRRSTRDDRETRLARALEAILPHVKIVPTRSMKGGPDSWKVPGIVLRDEPDAARFYRNRVSLGVAKLIQSYELRNAEYAMLLTEIRKALAAKITP